MKKYFLLFATSFIVFEAWLVAGSSSSYGMDQEPEKIHQGNVIYNSQRQKNQHISLYQEDPAADLRLYPAKGETVWMEEKQLQCYHPYFDGKVYSFLYPELIEVTLSYPAWNADLLSIADKLRTYNIEKTGIPIPGLEKSMKAFYKNSEEISIVSFEGELEQHSLTFSFILEEALQSPKEFRALLRTLQKSARQKEVHMIRTTFFPVHEIPLGLQQEGFLSMGEVIGFHRGRTLTAYYKILHSDFDVGKDVSNAMIEWEEKEDDFSPPNFGFCFGLFIRDGNGSIKGGISGSIQNGAAVPYSEIEIFYVDASLRGTGIGKKIFNMAEAFSKEKGVCCMQLDTMDYQAPWFYRKMGYSQVITEHESEKTLDGKWVSGYLFRKQL